MFQFLAYYQLPSYREICSLPIIRLLYVEITVICAYQLKTLPV
jgi:hypothetical protein